MILVSSIIKSVDKYLPHFLEGRLISRPSQGRLDFLFCESHLSRPDLASQSQSQFLISGCYSLLVRSRVYLTMTTTVKCKNISPIVDLFHSVVCRVGFPCSALLSRVTDTAAAAAHCSVQTQTRVLQLMKSVKPTTALFVQMSTKRHVFLIAAKNTRRNIAEQKMSILTSSDLQIGAAVGCCAHP